MGLHGSLGEMKAPLRLALMALTVAGCHSSNGSMPPADQGCTEIGCVGGLVMNFSKALTSPGSYKITVETEAGTSTCQTKLPFDGCSQASPCSSPGLILGQSGCALPASEHSLTQLQIAQGFPTSVKLTIERDGKPVATSTNQVNYQTSQPNGPNCPPICKQASLSVNIPSP